MAKITATQAKLLKAAMASRNGTCCTSSYYGHGSMGGVVKGGGRDDNAACKLRDAGLLEFVKHEHARNVSNGWSTHITDAVWSITEKGRQTAAAL